MRVRDSAPLKCLGRKNVRTCAQTQVSGKKKSLRDLCINPVFLELAIPAVITDYFPGTDGPNCPQQNEQFRQRQ